VLAPCEGRIPLEKRYADVAGMKVDRCRGEKLPGTMTRWVRKRGAAAFVVEFGPGSLSHSQVKRNARALREIAVG
jgi:hypothetical protein